MRIARLQEHAARLGLEASAMEIFPVAHTTSPSTANELTPDEAARLREGHMYGTEQPAAQRHIAAQPRE